MKPCICLGGYNEDTIKMARNAGFKYVELNFSLIANKSDAEYKEYVGFVRDLGLIPVAANGFFPGNWPIENGFFQNFDRVMANEYVDMAFEKTKDIKFNSIAFGSGNFRKIPEGYSRDKAKEIFSSFIAETVVPKLEKYDAVLSIEELNNKETNFLNSCAEALEIVNMVGSDRVGILCDYFHMTMAGETAKDVSSFIHGVTHIHIASPTNKRCFPIPTDGDHDNYVAFFEALKKNGYKHEYLSVEGGIPAGRPADESFNICYNYLSSFSDAF